MVESETPLLDKSNLLIKATSTTTRNLCMYNIYIYIHTHTIANYFSPKEVSIIYFYIFIYCKNVYGNYCKITSAQI